MKGKAPTIADVARVAGVSVPTVSRVLTGSIPVSAKRRELVQGAIETLGYQPNAAARALVSGTRSMVAVVAANTSRYGYAKTVEGIEEAARAAGYMVVITVVETADANDVRTAVAMAPQAGLVEGGGGGFAEGVGSDPGEFVGVGGLGGCVELDEEIRGVGEVDAVGRDEFGD